MKSEIENYSGRPLRQRTHLYSPAANAYDALRPRYAPALISAVSQLINIQPGTRMLEVGCGPGTVTTDFARLGCSIVALEPNPDFCTIATKHCRSFSNVAIVNAPFEEWVATPATFDVVISASAFHWVQPEIGYPKAASVLHDDGYFVLLWNREPQPDAEVAGLLAEVYRQHNCPVLDRFETMEVRQRKLDALAAPARESGLFAQIDALQIDASLHYSAEQYALLLSSYSRFLTVDDDIRNAVLVGLQEKIKDRLGGSIPLSYVSAAQVFRKT